MCALAYKAGDYGQTKSLEINYSRLVRFVYSHSHYGEGFGVGLGPIRGVPDGVGRGVPGGVRDGVAAGVGLAVGLGVTLGLGFGVGVMLGNGVMLGSGDGEAMVELGNGALKLKFESMPRFVFRFTF